MRPGDTFLAGWICLAVGIGHDDLTLKILALALFVATLFGLRAWHRDRSEATR